MPRRAACRLLVLSVQAAPRTASSNSSSRSNGGKGGCLELANEAEELVALHGDCFATLLLEAQAGQVTGRSYVAVLIAKPSGRIRKRAPRP
jgi:hypothetical protein